MYGDEHQLVTLSKRGDQRAYEQLYRANVGKIHALCLRLCGQREMAEDLTQEAFVKAWQRIASFRGDSAFGSWMYRLTTNLVISYMRQQTKWKYVDIEEEHFQDEDADVDSIKGESSDLERAIAGLPEQARVVLILYEFIGYQHNEISEITGLAVGTCKAHLHRAKNLLKERLVK